MEAQKILKMLEDASKELQKYVPEQMDRFWAFAEKVKEEANLSKREKALITLSAAMVKRCEPCVVRNLQEAIDAGITKKELVELCTLVILLDGGPGFAASAFLLEKYDELVSK